MTTTPWERQHAQLAAKYGTTDVDEAIRREIAEGKNGMRRCQWPECDEDISTRDPSAKYCPEHSKNKYTQALSRRKAKAMSEERKCEWPECDFDITDAHPLAKLCEVHKAEKKRQKAREYQKRAYAKKRAGQKTAATKKAKKPDPRPGRLPDKPPVTRVEAPVAPELPDNLCDTCGNADYTSYEDEDVCAETNAPLHGIVTSCEWYTTETPVADPRPTPEGHGPAISTKLAMPPIEMTPAALFAVAHQVRIFDLSTEASAFIEGYLAGRRAA